MQSEVVIVMGAEAKDGVFINGCPKGATDQLKQPSHGAGYSQPS